MSFILDALRKSENERQRQFLLGLGVTIGQGFLFSPGLAPEELQGAYPPRREPNA